MRKEKLYTGCLLLMALITGSCSEEENPEVRSATKPAEPYTSYYYYSYEAARQLSATDFALAEGQFTPGPTYIKGDTLFVANIQSGAFSLELYDRNKNRHLASLKSWKYKMYSMYGRWSSSHASAQVTGETESIRWYTLTLWLSHRTEIS